MADRIPLILNTNANQIQEMPSGDTLDLTGSNINGVGIITASQISSRITGNVDIQAGVITATTIDCNGDLDVDGHINFDNLSIAGVSTFAGVIEASAGQNKIPSLYNAMTDLPSAGTYHGMFAHVHATQRAYFAHGGGWYELVNKETTGVVGTGTESYNVGNVKVGTGVTIESNGQATFVGVVTFGSGSTTIDNNVVNVGTALTLGHTQGVQFHTQNLHSNGFEVNQVNASGIVTATTFSGSGASLTNLPAAQLSGTAAAINGSNITNLNASNIASGTVPTARLGSGTANSSTFLAGDSTFKTVTGTTINNNADNRIITGSGSANTLEGEADLTFESGTKLKNIGSGYRQFYLGSTNAGGVGIVLDGDSNGDGSGGDYATIEHDTTGNLHIRTDNPASTCSMAFSTNGSVRTIIDANGDLRPASNNSYNLGTNSYRWSNIHTNDLNLSNEGGVNDVDGTWGSYTIQEGESDLFLINKRNGKKYKFNLTEVT